MSLSKLHFAIRGRRPQEALAIYDALRYVPARYLCRLALLLGETGHPRYEEIARALIVSVTRELEPEILQIKKFADALAHIDDAAWPPPPPPGGGERRGRGRVRAHRVGRDQHSVGLSCWISRWIAASFTVSTSPSDSTS